MAKRPKRPLSVVEIECRKRGRRWGSENAARLAAMRTEIAMLKEVPTRWANAMTHVYAQRRPLGGGCYRGGRRSSSWEDAA